MTVGLLSSADARRSKSNTAVGDQRLWATARRQRTLRPRDDVMKPLLWIAAPVLLLAAVMLVGGVGAAGPWIALVAVGVALVAVDLLRSRRT